MIIKPEQMKAGTVIELLEMVNDPRPVAPATIGIVQKDVDWRQKEMSCFGYDAMAEMKWEDGRTLSLSTGTDRYLAYDPFELDDLKHHAYRAYRLRFDCGNGRRGMPATYSEFVANDFRNPEAMKEYLGETAYSFYRQLAMGGER